MSCFVLILILTSGVCSYETNMLPNRTTIVHLFEWKWRDVADECERFLAPKGFGGVQISPPSENLVIHKDGQRPWYERYQVMSYKLITRSGDQNDFLDMTRRCNNAGVRIYADVVVNHMTGAYKDNKGTGGSTADFNTYNYTGVPYIEKDFHYPHCQISNYYDVNEVRNCELLRLKDLNQTEEYVRKKIVRYFNKLIKLGVAGFRIDAAKHMWPSDLKEIYKQLNNLNPEYGFVPRTKPYIYQEVIYNNGEPIHPEEYTPFGDVTEFRVGSELTNVFRGKNAMKWLISWGEHWNLLPRESALTFIDNHDTQRSNDVLTYKESKAYKAAIAFLLAHPYGKPRVMSSYFFDNSEQGPPSDGNENIITPFINEDDTCGNGWVCEHRWRQIYNMISFRNAVGDANVGHWWDNGNKQIAFARGRLGFIVFNGDDVELNQNLQTGLPQGRYCDVISGKNIGGKCSGATVSVDMNGRAHFYISQYAEDMHIALHVGIESKL
ncbi:alpha-amylase-like [Vanessa atalanta]|uniref:alpha-amylase-like n=1 Tax=Vanessa atalanta TaxID=42275 RepID=UPI001FCCDE78|nr:alpha-amylase-like [Vanessa atalanta]